MNPMSLFSRGHELRFFLVTMTLICLSFLATFGSIHTTTDSLMKVTRSNQESDRYLEDLTLIEESIGDLDAPPNDIFVSKDARIAEHDIEAAYASYKELMTEIQAALSTTRTFGAVQTPLAEVARLVDIIRGCALTTIRLWRSGDTAAATTAMSHTDNVYREARANIAQIRKVLAYEQRRVASEQIDWIDSFNGIALLASLGNLSILLLVILSGYRLFLRLQRSEELKAFYKSAIDEMAIVATVDIKGVITYANSTFTKISGFEREELVGKTFDVVDSGRMPAGFYDEMRSTIAAGQTWRGQICHRAKDGHFYWVDTLIVPTLDRAGTVTQYTAILQDITARREMEDRLWTVSEMRRAILDCADMSMISTDLDGVIQSMNSGAERMLGYAAEELVGKETPAIIHDREELGRRAMELTHELGTAIRPGIDVFVAKTKQYKRPDEHEWTYVRKDGTRFPVSLSIASLYSERGDMTGYIGIAKDITEETRIRRELLDANRSAQAAAKAKSEFLAHMSHEIRTPLNGVLGVCALLRDGEQDPEQIERIRMIEDCGSMLLTVVNDILDFSKVEADKLEIERHPFAVSEASESIISLLKATASRKGISISLHVDDAVPQLVFGDTTRFKQVLSNLVGNAIKFTPLGRIIVKIGSTKLPTDDVEIHVSVTDTGVGIPKAAQEKIFNSFEQADASTTRRFGGTGLGLAISKGLCEKMGGRIWFESEEGVGTTFHFTIRAFEAVSLRRLGTFSEPLHEITPLPAPRQLKILVAEDNRINQIVTEGLLRKLGYTCTIAVNGHETLVKLESAPYDLILMDCHMPVMDGFEATRRIRAHHYAHPPRIIALTASTTKADVDRCYEAGMDGFLGKPLTVESLAGALATHMTTPVERPAPSPSPLKILDEKAFASRFRGMKDLANEMLEKFVRELPKLFDQVREAHQRRDWATLRRAAHTLKGATSNFCAAPVEALARRLEEAAELQNEATCDNLIAELDTNIEVLRGELNLLLPLYRGAA